MVMNDGPRRWAEARQKGEAEVLGNVTTNQTREVRCKVEVDERWRHGKGWNNQPNDRGATKGGGMMNDGSRRTRVQQGMHRI